MAADGSIATRHAEDAGMISPFRSLCGAQARAAWLSGWCATELRLATIDDNQGPLPGEL
jgi:hypothetical protein